MNRLLPAALSAWSLVLSGSLASAAQLSVSLAPDDPAVEDTNYPATGSTVTTVTDAPTGYILTVAGREYGVNPAPGNPRWGLQAGPLPWRPNQDGFVVRNGFAPSAPGSTTAASGSPASYVSITLNNVQANTLFQNVSIVFTSLDFSSTTNAWGASTAGGLSNWSVATLNGGGNRLTVNIPDFTWTGVGSLELRVYGITGQPEGAFGDVRVSGTTNPALPVPEPESAMLCAAALLSLRRRRSCK